LSINKKDILKFLLILIPFFALMVAWLGFGERGFVHLYRMEKERQEYVEKIQSLESENQRLLEEINRLRTDQEYIESVARRELGLIKDNEIIYRFNKKQKKVKPDNLEKRKSP
jgi:cell division protein FtsB